MESDGGREGIRPATAEEEALKRNTDCVYFLASPLTCKKGSECDYRHSEGARINPRDCWYWLNGNCLNPKCSFRHPPLDSLFVSPRPNSVPVQAPNRSAASAFTSAVPTPRNGNKQSAPCYYFQRGQCLKGERCPFMHGPQASVDFVLQSAAKASTISAQPRQINEKNAQKKIIMQQIVAELNLEKPKARAISPVGVSSAAAKIVTPAENAPKQESSMNKLKFPPQSFDDEHPALPPNGKPNNSVYFQSQPWGGQEQSTDEENEGGKDADELWREIPLFLTYLYKMILKSLITIMAKILSKECLLIVNKMWNPKMNMNISMVIMNLWQRLQGISTMALACMIAMSSHMAGMVSNQIL